MGIKDEMNKKIHELRGKCWHDFVGQNFDPTTLKCRHCRCRGEKWANYENPDYKNNIADAWELFEEMPQLLYKRLDSYSHGWICNSWEGVDKPYFGRGKTPMEAICKAYIAWKEKT